MGWVYLKTTCPWCGKVVKATEDPVTFQSCRIIDGKGDEGFVERKPGKRYNQVGGQNPKSIKGVIHRKCFDEALEKAWKYDENSK